MTVATNAAPTRRRFLKTAAATAAGLAFASKASSYQRILGSNDRVNVALIGFADRARASLIPAFMQHARELNFDLVALSDIWSLRREEGAAHLSKVAGREVAAARNNDELYARKDVDAVIIATADFQHALHCVEAVKAGRDAYVEKPFADTMEDARLVLKTVEGSDRIVQVGTQRRSGANYTRADEFIRSGKFGDIVMVEMTWNVNQPGRWRRPALVERCRREDLDWDRYVLNRKEQNRKPAFDPRKYVEYRLFYPYSSGIPDQWMVHQIDTVHWFTGLPRPRSVVANGGIYFWRDGRTNFDTMTAVFDYGDLKDTSAKGFQVVYSSRMTNAAGGTREIYYSNGGTLNLDTNKISSEGGLEQRYADEMKMPANQLGDLSLVDETRKSQARVETGANTGSDPLTNAHVRNWMECVRDRKQPNAPVRAGYNHSVALCMTIAALHTGKRVTFDDARQDVVVA